MEKSIHENRTVSPAEGMQLRLTEQIVAVLTDTIQPREYALVVYTLALNVEEVGPLAEGVVEYEVTRGRRPASTSAPELLQPRGAGQHTAEEYDRRQCSRRARSSCQHLRTRGGFTSVMDNNYSTWTVF